MLLLRRLLLPFLALAVVWLVVRIHATSGLAQTVKQDLATIDDVQYGLLDADVWVGHLVVAMNRQIETFGEEPARRDDVQRVFERVISRLITEVERTIRLQNEERPFGSLRQLATDFVVDFDGLRASSGELAEIAVSELERPENRDRLKTFLEDRVTAFADSTFADTDRSAFVAVLESNGCEERGACRSTLTERLGAYDETLMRDGLLAIVAVAAMMLLAAWPGRHFGAVELSCVLVGVFALLLGGVLTPMIDVKAEIARLDLTLIGASISFENQVLFFQSKSILDVVELLVRTRRADLVLVGLGIGLFSVVFPACKLLATLAYRYASRARSSGLVRFFALDSGKWSMADVFVIAMFLAFLGFDGLTGNQLAALLGESRFADVATENGTQLRVGFHLFAAFCIAGLALSSIVKRGVEMSPRPVPDV
ncbi:MAG: paraquat-inducible protein A [Gemmatimonadetes bacterium]|nr:paraquat-inducible protein A [Gemmatimonadota bacterium]